jgi:hypothetical protein
MASLADATIEAQREERRSRPWVQVKAALQARLLKETFQNHDQVAIALAIAEIKEPWKKIAAELGEKSNENRDWLNRLVHRRNQIVHEGDLERASRPRKVKFNEDDHELRGSYGTGHGPDGRARGLHGRHARLAVGMASTLATFLLETHREQG